MSKRPARCTAAVLTLLLLVEVASGPGSVRAGSVTYLVDVNTNAIAGQAGNLDFQFNPGGLGSEFATTTVTSFQTSGGLLSQPATLTGDASGSLPGTLTLDNGTAYNDVFQGFTFGSKFDILLTLSGPALNSPGGSSGSSFALSLYDAAGVTPLLTTDPNGSVLTVDQRERDCLSTDLPPEFDEQHPYCKRQFRPRARKPCSVGVRRSGIVGVCLAATPRKLNSSFPENPHIF